MTLRSPRKRATWPATYRPAESVSGRRPERVRPTRVLAQFVSHSLPSGAVHHRPARTLAQFTDGPGPRCTQVNSVGKRVGCKPSRVRISHPPPGTCPPTGQPRPEEHEPVVPPEAQVPAGSQGTSASGTAVAHRCPKGRTAVGHRCSRARRTIGPPRRPKAQTAPTARPPTSAQRRNPQPRRPNPRSPMRRRRGGACSSPGTHPGGYNSALSQGRHRVIPAAGSSVRATGAPPTLLLVIFKQVGEGRPYPDPALSTREWAKIPPRQVRLDELITTKAVLDLHQLLARDSTFYGDLFPHVIQWRGDLYLEDGLHRALRAALHQRAVVHARVLDLDSVPSPASGG